MAQPASLPATVQSATPAGAGDADLRKETEEATARLAEFLRRYAPAKAFDSQDTLQGRYRIDFLAPVPEFDTPHAKAYAAADTTEPSRQLIASLCMPGNPPRMRVVNLLYASPHPHILALPAAGVVELSRSGEQRFVIIHERPAGSTLSALLAEKKIPLNAPFICEHILMPLAQALQHCSELDIAHGLVNPENIYFDEKAMLGPCTADPCGFSQPFHFESLERMQAMPCAKGEGSTAGDYYALAVTLLYILHGPEHFAAFTPGALIRLILQEGPYNALLRQKPVPEIFYDFFRGMLTQSTKERWNDRQLKPWLEGKRYNVLPPPPPVDAVRPFEFGDMQAATRREAAHLFASDWEHMIAALHNNQLAHWVAISLRDKELSENIGRLSRTVIELAGKNEVQSSELMMNIVMLLDPEGPVRIRQLSMHIDGLPSFCADMYGRKAHPELQFLAGFIETNMVNYWLTLQMKNNGEYQPPPAVNAVIAKLDRLRTCIRSPGLGFGLERMFYDLNPDMPCMSPLLANRHIVTLPDLLRELDRMAASLQGEEMIDRHITAFIASRLNIQHEIRMHDLTSLPAFASSRTVMALHLLAMAQDKGDAGPLPGITHWLAIRLLPLIDTLHSHTLRQQLKTLLIAFAPAGLAQKMAELIVTAEYADADRKGFQRAQDTYRKNAAEIASLQNPERIRQESMQMGLHMATLVAYGALLFSMVIILRGIFM